MENCGTYIKSSEKLSENYCKNYKGVIQCSYKLRQRCQSCICHSEEDDMRKKSHISLAWYLMNNEGMESVKHHKGAFYIGSILPDCIPSFLVRKHTIEDSFDVLEKEISKLVSHFDPIRGLDSYTCRHLGVITHYVADYFTFPHNQNFPGNLKDHCIYEEELKKELRKYVRKPEVERGRLSESVHTPEAILSFVQRMHQIYMRMQSGVKRDCEYIIELCHTVVDALLILFEELTKQLHLSLLSL